MAQKIRMIHTSGVVKYHNVAYANSEYAAKDGWTVQDPTLENDTPVAIKPERPGGEPASESSSPGSEPDSEPAKPVVKRGRKAKTK
jgi:hypothetical protein